MKLYLLYCDDKEQDLPVNDRKFVNAVFKILYVTPKKISTPSPETVALKDRRTQFYKNYHEATKAVNDTDLSYYHLSTAINYMSDDIVTMYENIKQHFCDYVELFINVEFHLKDQIEVTKASSEMSSM